MHFEDLNFHICFQREVQKVLILLLQSTLSKYKEMNCAQIRKKKKKDGLSRLHTYHFCGPIPVIQSFKCQYFHTANDIYFSSSNCKEVILLPPKSKGMKSDDCKTQHNQIHLPPLGAASLLLSACGTPWTAAR